jgi:hypothetical protein
LRANFSRLDHGGIGLVSNFGYMREILNKIKLNEAQKNSNSRETKDKDLIKTTKS